MSYFFALMLIAHADSYAERASAQSSREYNAKKERQLSTLAADNARRMTRIARFVEKRGGSLGSCTVTLLRCFGDVCQGDRSTSQSIGFYQIDRALALNVTHCQLTMPPELMCEANPTHYPDQASITCYPPRGPAIAFTPDGR